MQSNVIAGYTPVVVSASDYYSFGMQQPGRTVSASGYRYDFNGKEKETELNENITTAQFWEYDSRIGRRWNMDPVVDRSTSPFSAMRNSPIFHADPSGAKPAPPYTDVKENSDGSYTVVKAKNDNDNNIYTQAGNQKITN